MPQIVNEAVLHVWRLGSALTGLSGNMSASLKRYSDSSTEVAASESVTIAEIGSTGNYSIAYTPTSSEVYSCLVSESSLSMSINFEDEVIEGLSTLTANSAYCSEADVVAVVQSGDYTGSTIPTENNVLLFMQSIASEVYSWMVEKVGSSAPGPASYALTIDTGSDGGLALASLTRHANAIGAAAMALESGGASQAPARSERVNELKAEYYSLKMSIQTASWEYIGAGQFSETHITEGRVTVDDWTSKTQDGFTFSGSSEW